MTEPNSPERSLTPAPYPRRPGVRGWAVGLCALLLSACSLSPGIRFGSGDFFRTRPAADSAPQPAAAQSASGQSASAITEARRARAAAGGASEGPAAERSAAAPRGQATPAAQRAAVDTPPPGALIPINPELLKRQRASRPTDLPPAVRALLGTPQPYLIGPGDVVNINVWNHPELVLPPAGGLGTDAQSLSGVGNGYNVNAQGLIQFPYVGVLKIGGLNEYDARELITKGLSRYLKDPQVTVRIQAYRSGRVYVDGEVRLPGLQAFNDLPMTLPEVLGRAGGFTPLADRSQIALTRSGVTTMVNLRELTDRGVNPNGIVLANGDLIRVLGREESKVFVLGEVGKPGTLLMRNGRLTLNEALGEAGGVNPLSGDPRQIFVVRPTDVDRPEIYHLDASTPVAYALAEGFELRPADVVYVDPSSLVRWNRVISLIVPSAQAAYFSRLTANP